METFTITEAASYLNISKDTLRLWEKNGKFTPMFKTIGGHRRYTKEQLDNFFKIQK